MATRPLVAGNWKMNGLAASSAEFDAIAEGLGDDILDRVDVAICPPYTLVALLAGRGTMVPMKERTMRPKTNLITIDCLYFLMMPSMVGQLLLR